MYKVFLLLLGIGLNVLAQIPSAIEWNNQGSAAFASFQYHDAEANFRKAVAIVDQSPQADSAQRATIYSNLAAVYRSEARYTEAEPLYQRALDCAHGDAALSRSPLRGLALLYSSQGKLVEAEHFGRLAIQSNGENQSGSRRISEAYNDLAIILLERGKFEEARTFASQALSSAPAQEAATGNALNTLGRIALAQKDGPNARRYLLQSSEILKNTLRPGDPALAAVWANLGHAYSLCGDWQPAIELLVRAIASLEKIKGRDHPDVASALNNLGTVYENRKQFKKARSVFGRALTIDSRTLGADSIRAATDFNNLGSIAFFQHRWSDAETLLNRALAINSRILGEHHPETGELAANLAILYAKQQRYAEAGPLLRQAIVSREINYGAYDVTLSKLLTAQAGLFRRQGQFSEAQQAEARYMKIAVRNAIRDARKEN